jgi:hypothetical protein
VAELAEFQRAAVARIVARLRDANGSHRFLLADEVGLGKTLVARGVIEEMRRHSKEAGFTVVYVCSNSEIAGQNRDKLCPEKGAAHSPGRLTLLSLQSSAVNRRREDGQVQIFSFTPNTSLQIGNATGVKQERRLLMYLIMRVWGRHVNRQKWRDFFRCSAGRQGWDTEARFYPLRRDFLRVVASEVQQRLRGEWGQESLKLIEPDTGKERSPLPLRDCLEECVDTFREEDKRTHKNRNLVIGRLRHCLARVALDFLRPDLIILDEFQRFSDILENASKEGSIVGKLFGAPGSSILILSATPYRLYTLQHESEDHHADFMRTYEFLKNKKDGISHMREMLKQFRSRLEEGRWLNSTDQQLRDLKQEIEDELKLVMCRTERNWYLDGADKGVSEVWDSAEESPRPIHGELLEYIRLREFLLLQKIADWNITDFWKSSPSLLSFMDGHYALVRRLRIQRAKVPSTIFRKPDELDGVGENNLKFRLLFKKVFGDKLAQKSDGKANRWKYLWIGPTYTYYKDQFYGDNGPRKYLVFSHWKFVPKAISIVVSDELVRRLGRRRKRQQSAPLQFRARLAFYPLDVCYPSPVLAESIRQTVQGQRTGDRLPREVLHNAEKRVKELLLAAGIEVATTQSVPVWRIVARLEALSPFAEHVRRGLNQSQVVSRHETSEHYPAYVAQYRKWMDDTDTPLAISPRWIRRLTLIALYSPAVCTLRAVASVFTDWAAHWLPVMDLCVNQMRSYFNKPLAQTVIRNEGGASLRSYTEKVIGYCQKAHFQAMMDEYVYLLRNVLQRGELPDLVAHLGRVFGMGTGQPLVNQRTRTGRMGTGQTAKAAHFALAFADDVSAESMQADGSTRRSAVRESFNSPLWPFVLATTSVGQEGLDFHLYCRDIVHWNLPSNPVDLEQREGRINRYSGFCIRQNIAKDFSLPTLSGTENIWTLVFGNLDRDLANNCQTKHGLCPHWVYQPTNRSTKEADDAMVKRHLLFYASSRDVARYRQLKSALVLYRLVFGQPRQQDIVERIMSQLHSAEISRVGPILAEYTINLSPLSKN